MTFVQVGDIEHDEDYQATQRSSKVARQAFEKEIQQGKGTTEAFQDIASTHKRQPTVTSVRKVKTPRSSKMSTEMQMLCLLQRTYNSVIHPDGLVPGYIQVSTPTDRCDSCIIRIRRQAGQKEQFGAVRNLRDAQYSLSFLLDENSVTSRKNKTYLATSVLCTCT